MKPFRWNIAKREQLGTLLADTPQRNVHCNGFLDDVRNTSARLISMADDADFAFIGRTPENFFDYLSGAFADISDAPALHLVQFSLRWAGEDGVEAMEPEKLAGFFDYLDEEGLTPSAIASGPRPLALIDFVSEGGTMENMIRLLKLHAKRDGADWNAVQRRLKIIGLRVRTHNSPNTWRWQQHQDWLHLIPDAIIKNVSAPGHLLYFIANTQPKVTRAHHPGRWIANEDNHEPITPAQLKGLAVAVGLYDAGRTRGERQQLARTITKAPEMRQPATRRIVTLLKS